jgi:hypothetical protein
VEIPLLPYPWLTTSCDHWLLTHHWLTRSFGRSDRLLLAITSTFILGSPRLPWPYFSTSQPWLSHETDLAEFVCLSDRKIAACPHQHSLPWFWVTRYSWPHFSGWLHWSEKYAYKSRWASLYSLSMDHIKNTVSNIFSIIVYISVAMGMCWPSHCLTMDVSSASAILTFRHFVTLLPS